jgi:hypothetical protein
MNEPEPEHIINDHDPVNKDTNLIGTSAASSPSAAAPKKEDTNLIGTEQIVPSSDVLNKQALANAASADANVAEYKKAIAILNELLNKLKSDLETAPANAEDIEHAIEIGTKLLNKLNAAIGTTDTVVPVVADVADVPDANGVPVVTGAAGPCGGVRASLLSSVDPSCYIAPDLPPLAQMIQAAFANEISTAGREIVMNFLEQAGIQGLQGSVLTTETINQLDELSHSKDPKVRKQIADLQINLKNVAAEAVTGIQEDVEPQLEKVVGDVEAKAVGGLSNAFAANPIIGDTEAFAQELGAVTEVANQIPAIGKEIEAKVAPLEKLTDKVDAVTNSITSITPPVLPSITSTGLKMQSGPGVQAQTITPKPRSIVAAHNGGSSRKRRRIHKLSRRIERTLRRVHRLKGDKNSFLRRTINAKKMK